MYTYIVIGLLLICNVSANEIDTVQELLNSNHFIYKPQLDIFDCVDMSIGNQQFLKNHGYESRIAILEDGFMPNGIRLGHCVAIVKINGYWIGVETKQAVINTSQSIGKLVGINPAFIRMIFDKPEEVYDYDLRGKPVITGNVIAKNV